MSFDEELTKLWRKIFELPQKEMRKQFKQIDLSQKTSNNQNILHIACQDNKKLSIEILLSFLEKKDQTKFDLNQKDSDKGWTPVYYLIESSDGSETEILQMLIKAGSLINISDKKGITPLHLVSFKGQDEYMSILIHNNCDINKKDNLGRIPLNYAIMEGQLNSAYLLLEAGADICSIDNDKNSLLHYAVSSKGNALLFSIMLIDRKINLNLQNNDGDTPIMLIAKNNPKENVRLLKKLINSGAHVDNIINYNCQSFWSLMGEAAIKDDYYGIKNNDEYKNININDENNKAMNKMIEVIKNKISRNKESNKGDKYKIILSIIILIASLIIKKNVQ